MYTKHHGFMNDMDKTTLLKMRDEEGLTLGEIARRVGCSKSTISRIMGPMTPEARHARKVETGLKTAEARWGSKPEGEYTAERKLKSYMPKREEARKEVRKVVLVMKPVRMPIPLHGEYMDYVINEDRTLIDVETEQGRGLIQIPVDKLETFIAELTAIQRNIGEETPGQFWG